MLRRRTHHDLADPRAPGEKDEIEGSRNSSVVSSRLVETAASASGSKYLGMSARSSVAVAGASDTFRMQVLPAAGAVIAGRKSKSKGPLNGPMINVTPYGSRYTIPLP
jgi:hypothetical protein